MPLLVHVASLMDPAKPGGESTPVVVNESLDFSDEDNSMYFPFFFK